MDDPSPLTAALQQASQQDEQAKDEAEVEAETRQRSLGVAVTCLQGLVDLRTTGGTPSAAELVAAVDPSQRIAASQNLWNLADWLRDVATELRRR